MDLLSRLSSLAKYDTFQKSREHVQVRTVSGAAVSIVSGAIMLLLFLSEFNYFLTTNVEHHVLVDTSQADREFDITLDISFLALHCKSINLQVEDTKGMSYDAAHVSLVKTPQVKGVDAPGSAVTAPGCRVSGTLRVRKVAGNFHVSPGFFMPRLDSHGAPVWNLSPQELTMHNCSHVIHKLSFGSTFPGQVSPLDGARSPTFARPANYQYHIRVVPTLYERLSGAVIDSQQFSVADFAHPFDFDRASVAKPGVWFKYDFSPIMVRLVETRRSFLQFLTSVCAILGGVFAISGLVDQAWYRTVESRKTK